MATDMRKQDFAEVVSGVGCWATIDELIEQFDDKDYWNEDFYAEAVRDAKAAHIRRGMREQKKADGEPEWRSVMTTRDDGQVVRVYKQEVMFNLDDFRQVHVYHCERAMHHISRARYVARTVKKEYGVQLTFPFDLGPSPN